jgi:hypothetical protein
MLVVKKELNQQVDINGNLKNKDMSKCIKCRVNLPNKRIELGYNECIECANTEVYGTVPLTFHKTGNSLQHTSKETAHKINKAARRNTYGSNLGQIGKGGHTEFARKINVGCSTSFIGSQKTFERIGEEAMLKLDLLGLDKALDFIKRKHESLSINTQQFNKLKQTLEAFSQV